MATTKELTPLLIVYSMKTLPISASLPMFPLPRLPAAVAAAAAHCVRPRAGGAQRDGRQQLLARVRHLHGAPRPEEGDEQAPSHPPAQEPPVRHLPHAAHHPGPSRHSVVHEAGQDIHRNPVNGESQTRRHNYWRPASTCGSLGSTRVAVSCRKRRRRVCMARRVEPGVPTA